MKRAKIIISIATIIWWTIPFISFWQTQSTEPCLTCWTSPTNLTLINNFTTEILATIKTIWTEVPYVGKHVPPSRFDSWKFIAPKQGIMSKSLRRAKEELASILAIKRVHLERRDLADLWNSMRVLSKNNAILRDWQKVSKIEQIINKKKYELSIWWWRTDKIWWVTLININNIIQRYKELWILGTETKIGAGAEYWDLILILWRLNSSMKQLVSIWWSSAEQDDKEPNFKLWISGKIALKIDGKTLIKIKSDYNCTRRYACEQSRTNLKSEFKKIMDSFKNWLWNIWDEIRAANKKLWNAYSSENLKKTFVSENTIVTQFSWALNNINKRINRQTAAEAAATRNPNETVAKTVTTNNPDEKITPPLQITTANKDDIINNFTERIVQTENTIIAEHETMTQKYYTTKTPDITTYFVAITQKINQINKIIWSKDTEDCLIKNLWSLCEKQCSNIWNKKCYY